MKKRLSLLAEVWTAQVGAPQGFANYVVTHGPQLFEYYGNLAANADVTETREVMGGSATIMTMASLGLLLNVKRRRLSLFY